MPNFLNIFFLRFLLGFIFLFGFITIFVFYNSSETLSFFRPAFTILEEDDDVLLSHQDDETNSSYVRIACLINTWQKNHKTKAKAVMDTWGRRCDKVIFVSSVDDPKIPSFSAQLPDGRKYLWGKIKRLLIYGYEHFLDDVDWFYKADDDTYVVLENARRLANQFNPDGLYYFGCRFKPFSKRGYMSGGSGYLMSKGALKKFVEVGLKKNVCQAGDEGSSDTRVGQCMDKLNAHFGDSRDEKLRLKFFPLNIESYVVPENIPKKLWIWSYTYYPLKGGKNCCSDRAVAFHYVPPKMMYVMDYLIYVLKTSY